MIHYHGTPVTPRVRIYELAGRHFCVSFANPQDIEVVHEIGQSVMLDNGAFSFWRGTGSAPNWKAYYDWAESWLDYPTTWAVIPDVIDGGEGDNDRLLVEWWQRRLPKGAPVWHLHEPLDRLRRLVAGYEKVCFGSSGVYSKPSSDAWRSRVSDAFDVISDEQGRVPWIHMLRGLGQAGDIFPFASADSANAARNSAGSKHRRRKPIGSMVAGIDAVQCPGRWVRPVEEEQIEGQTQIEVEAL